MADLKRLFIGKPLKSAENDEHKLSRFAALALLSSDALSSIAYGTEQIVVVLVTLSAAAIWYSLPIAAFVIILLISLTLSYRQIIHAYPHGGGAYVVSSENLGRNAGLLAGGSLLVDYMLTSSRFSFSGCRGDYISDSSVIWSSSSNFYWDCDIDYLNELERPARICFVLNVASV